MPAEQRLLLDVQDLLEYLHDYGSVSGIQRVQLGILASVLRGEAGPLGARCLPVFGRLADNALLAPRAADMADIITHCTGAARDHEAARALVARARDNAEPVQPGSTDTLLVLGAFWFFAGASGFLAALKRQGVRLGVLIYDSFPATHPEFATDDTVRYFNQALNEGLVYWDFALAISEYSAASFRRIAEERGFPPIPVVAVPLAHSFGMGTTSPDWLDTFPQSMQDIRGREFVLCVCTIEVRKNHLLLFHAWQRMIEAGDNPPPIIFAGRIGWGVKDLMAQLDATRCLDGRIMLALDVSDAELAALYRNALFTVFPSHAEGWGLAVGESLSFGKACLAAGVTALPEVGGDLVAYADPGSVPDWIAKLRAWLHDRDALRAAEARIAQQFAPRQWPDVARRAVEQALALGAGPVRHVPHDALPLLARSGQTLALGASFAVRGGADEARAAIAQSHSFASGWHPVEWQCTWMRLAEAELLLRVEEPPGALVAAELVLRASAWDADNPLTLAITDGPETISRWQPGTTFTASCYGPVAADGSIRITLRLARLGQPHPDDARGLSIGIDAITIRRADSLPAPQPRHMPTVAVAPPPHVPLPEPPSVLLGAVQRLWAPLKYHRLRAEWRRAHGDWARAAQGYTAFLRRRPNDAGMLLKLAECLARAGDAPGAYAALARADSLAGIALPEAIALQAARDAQAPILFVDFSALLAAPEAIGGFAARRWMLGLARALLARPGTHAVVSLPHEPFPRLLADWMPGALLETAWQTRPARLAGVLGTLPAILPGAEERAILLGPPPVPEIWRSARGAGAMVLLAQGEPAMLTTPHRAAAAPVAALQAAMAGAVDALLLPAMVPAPLPVVVLGTPAPDAGARGATETPPPGAVICDEITPWLREAWQQLDAPPLIAPSHAEAALTPMLRDAPLAICTATDGAWPALRQAAAMAGIACLSTAEGIAPLDAATTARVIRTALAEPPRRMAMAITQRSDALLRPTPQDWPAIAEAAATASPGAAPQAAITVTAATLPHGITTQ